MSNNNFNLLAAWDVWQKQWKTIVLFVILTVIAATATVFCVPQYYRSKATVLPGNSVLADKARLFNSNIQSLYSYFGSGDDLDRIYSIAVMDTTYKTLVDEFNLVAYYELKNDSIPLMKRKAVLLLKKDLQVQKTENGQLQIIAWTKSKQLSAAIVNRLVVILQQRQSAVWEENYNRSLTTLDNSIKAMEAEYAIVSDSLSLAKPVMRELIAAKLQSLLDQIKEYRKASGDFTLAIRSQPAVLYVMEAAVPAAKAERPDKLAVILAAFIISTIFICLLVLLNNRNTLA